MFQDGDATKRSCQQHENCHQTLQEMWSYHAWWSSLVSPDEAVVVPQCFQIGCEEAFILVDLQNVLPKEQSMWYCIYSEPYKGHTYLSFILRLEKSFLRGLWQRYERWKHTHWSWLQQTKRWQYSHPVSKDLCRRVSGGLCVIETPQ